MVSGTIEAMGTMLAGQTADALYASVSHADLLSIGLNCATGPEFMTDHIRTLERNGGHADLLLSERRDCPMTKASTWKRRESLAAQLERFIDHGWLNIVGGCCGTTAEHIAAIAQMAAGKKPRARQAVRRTAPITPASNWWKPRRATAR